MVGTFRVAVQIGNLESADIRAFSGHVRTYFFSVCTAIASDKPQYRAAVEDNRCWSWIDLRLNSSSIFSLAVNVAFGLKQRKSWPAMAQVRELLTLHNQKSSGKQARATTMAQEFHSGPAALVFLPCILGVLMWDKNKTPKISMECSLFSEKHTMTVR